MVTASRSVRGTELMAWMLERTEAMCDLAKTLVEVESPTGDGPGVAEALGVLATELEALDFRVRMVRGGVTEHLLASPAGRARGRPLQLLLGHIDTVWPRGVSRTMPFRRAAGRLHGPGILDMKGGLAQLLFALKGIRELGLALPATPVVFVNSDEETGSKDSTRHIQRLARSAARAFVVEPADGPRGAIKTARKGVGRYRIKVHGRAAHAGLSPQDGASAILEMSHLVQELFDLNDPEQGVTVNVGTIDGGLGANVVAPTVVAEVDVRAWTEADAARVARGINALTPTNPRCEVHIDGRFGRRPMEPTERNQALWSNALQIAAELDVEIRQARVGGGSDANTTSRFTATLDGLGAVGQGAHADDEQLVVAAMPERAALLAALLTSALDEP